MDREHPKNLKYTKEHEWIDIQDDIAICGITDYAQELMTEIVYVELPEVGEEVGAGDKIASLESVKSVSDIYSPLSGKVIEINEDTEEDPGLVNRDAFGDGWILKIKLSDPGEIDHLLSAEEYSLSLEE